ncbi:hypothetical protein TNCV_3287021 [Trichonephila clavipes]|nr:hypothetical protein TNCV_3287021 [Trichonephila clavipes]
MENRSELISCVSPIFSSLMASRADLQSESTMMPSELAIFVRVSSSLSLYTQLNSVARQLMRSKAYCAQLSIRDLGPDVHEQMFQPGGQSNATPPVLSSQTSLGLTYRLTEGMKVRVTFAQPGV